MTRIIPPVLLLCASAVLAAAPVNLQPETLARLAAGEVVPGKMESDKGGGTARFTILVRAPVEAIWGVIISCDFAFAFVEGLQHCEVLVERGDYAETHQVVKKRFPVPVQDFVFETRRKPHERMDFKLKEGNLKAMEGSWEFIGTDEGTVIVYEIRIQPGMPAPDFMVRRNLHKTMPDMLACIRGLAEGSGSAKMQEADIGRCPGEVSRP